MRIAVDVHPSFPLRGKPDGWIRDINGSRVTLFKGQANTLDVAIFVEGVYQVTPGYASLVVEFKSYADAPPIATDVALTSDTTSIVTATRAAWEAGTGQHGRISLTSGTVALLDDGVNWMIIQLSGTGSTPVAAGRINVS